jgi:OOP family OmpA-OmpF porin
MLRKVLFCSSAVALVAFWAAGETPGVAQEAQLCNPVLDSSGNPVVESGGGVVTHSGTFPCPVETAAVETVPEVEPAAPPPEPLPEGGVVFFPLDVAELDDEARQTLGNIVNEIQDRDLQGITVAGHADRSGPEDYNMQLSDRRAQNVAAELVKSGIPARVIETEAFGETQPAVPTDDGVVLQANRRAVVDFEF